MKRVIKLRMVLLAVWVAAAVLLGIFMPDMEALIRDKGQPKIPETYSSVIAEDMLNKVNGVETGSGKLDIVVVFHEDAALTDAQKEAARQSVKQLETDADKLGILQIISSFANDSLTSELVSADGTTIMVPIRVDPKERSVAQVRDDLHADLPSDKVHSYLTGNKLINEDQIETSQAGVKKTEKVTVLFIIVILVLIFRSPITPFVTLLVVGISYFVSLGVVALLVDKLNFPFATTTQTFLILVLFGIGTDYTILLFSRFKEELGRHPSSLDAMAATYRTAGRTVLYSGLAVWIGFGILGFARFSIYRSSVAVAIGVIILLLCLLTLLPIAMVLFGKHLFWPMRKITGHGDNRFWLWLGRFATARPIRALLVVLVLTLPFIYSNPGKLSYNSMEEAGKTAESAQGFRFLSDGFTPGKALPTTVIVSAAGRFDTSERLAWVDRLTSAIAAVPGVQSVSGPTRPKGDKVDSFYVEKQAGAIAQGLAKSTDSMNKLSGQLTGMAAGAQGAASPSPEPAPNPLVQGLMQSAKGLQDMAQGLAPTVTYLKGLGQSQGESMFYVPADKLQGDYQKALDSFMAKDRQSFKLSVVLSVDPYSNEAMDIIDRITGTLDYELASAPIDHPAAAIGGVSSINRDLNDMANRDFTRTVVLMLAAILLMLVLILRVFWIPVYILAALVGAYYTALSIVSLAVVPALGMSGLSWTVPFFSFIMVVALGVDYSIFVMMRYKEYAHMPRKEALLQAMQHIGGVILSAAVILSGTFAAMIPSGVPSLILIATVVIIALVFLSILLLPILLPALIMLQHKLNPPS